jgi:dienelactone hydrolase
MLVATIVLSACGATATPVPAPTAAPTAEVVPTQESAAEPTAEVVPTDEPTEEPTEVIVPTEPPTTEPTAEPQPAEVEAVPFDLGDATLVQAEFVPERVREMPVRLEGMVAVPPEGDNLPLAVIVHGSHGSGCPSPDGVTEGWPCPDEERRHYEGFAYLLQALAERGYVALAINANPLYVMAYGEANTSMRAPVLFDLYMEKVAAAASGEDVGLSVDLAGRVDLNRLAVLGHSMGGTAVDTIMAGRAGQTGPEQVDAGQGPVAAAFLLAPFEYSDANQGLTAPTAILLPACDRDVAGLDGQLYYERERAMSDTENTVISVLLQWANHNRFNTELEDEWLGRGSKACTPETLLPAEEQQQFLADYVPRFFDVALGIREDEASLLGLDASQPEPATLFGREVLTSLLLPSAQRLALPLDSGTAAGSATVAYCPAGYVGIDSVDAACRRQELSQPGNPEQWVISWEGTDGSYKVTVPEASRDLSGYESLQLRAVVDPLSELNPEGQPQAFSVRLTDSTGAAAVVPLTNKPALAYPYGATITFEERPDVPLWDNNLLLSSIRVPLAQFAGIDLRDVQSVALVFDTTGSGTIFVSDLELLQAREAD